MKKSKLYCLVAMILALMMICAGALMEGVSESGDANRSIQITSDSLTVKIGGKLTLKAESVRLTEDAPKKTSFVWSSADESIAKVASNGTVTGVSVGETVITCAAKDDERITSSVTVSVYQPVKSLKTETTKMTLRIGLDDAEASVVLKTIITPDNATYTGVIFESSNPEVATVSENGMVQAVAAGKTRISIISEEPGSSLKAVCDVTVDALITAIQVPEEIVLEKDESYTLSPEIIPVNPTNSKLIYESLNPAVATVSSSGVVKAVGYGSAVIRVSSADEGQASSEVTISIECPISEERFPDQSFRAWISEKQDLDHDGKLSGDELALLTEMDISGQGIEKLDGIEAFYNLRSLNCSKNELQEIRMKENPLLEVFDCSENRLHTLDVSKLSELRDLDCHFQSKGNLADGIWYYSDYTLKKLDVSHNLKLTRLNCKWGALKSLDVRKNLELEFLNCDCNQIAQLDVSRNSELKELRCARNEIKNLNVSKNTELVVLDCGMNQIRSVDISSLVALQELDCGTQLVWGEEYDTYVLKKIQFGNISGLTSLVCDNCLLSGELSLVNFPNLKVLDAKNSEGITAVDVTGCPDLEVLNLWNCTGISAIDVTHNPNLQELDLEQTGLSTIDLSHNTHLKKLGLGYEYTDVTSMSGTRTVDLSANTELTSINLFSLSGPLDLRAQEGLEELRMNNCNFSRIYINRNENLREWIAMQTNTNYVDFSLFPNLTRLALYESQNWILDVTQNPKLEYLDIDQSYVYDIDLSHNAQLKKLSIAFNHMTKLDVSHNPLLEELACYDLTTFTRDGGLVNLDLSQNHLLKRLYVRGNKIRELDISGCPLLVELVKSEVAKYSAANDCFIRAESYGMSNGTALLSYDVFTKIIADDYSYDPVKSGIANAMEEEELPHKQDQAEIVSVVNIDEMDATLTWTSDGHIKMDMPIDVHAVHLAGKIELHSPNGTTEGVYIHYSNIEKAMVGDAKEIYTGWIEEVSLDKWAYLSPDSTDQSVDITITVKLDQEGNVKKLDQNETQYGTLWKRGW